jgi:hypothetical protein
LTYQIDNSQKDFSVGRIPGFPAGRLPGYLGAVDPEWWVGGTHACADEQVRPANLEMTVMKKPAVNRRDDQWAEERQLHLPGVVMPGEDGGRPDLLSR